MKLVNLKFFKTMPLFFRVIICIYAVVLCGSLVYLAVGDPGGIYLIIGIFAINIIGIIILSVMLYMRWKFEKQSYESRENAKKVSYLPDCILGGALGVFAQLVLSYLFDYREAIPRPAIMVTCGIAAIILGVMYIRDIAAYRREKSATRRVKPPLKNGIGTAVLIVATVITVFI